MSVFAVPIFPLQSFHNRLLELFSQKGILMELAYLVLSKKYFQIHCKSYFLV